MSLLLLTACEVPKSLLEKFTEISTSYEKSTIKDDSFKLLEYETISSDMPKKGVINPITIPIMFDDYVESSKYSQASISKLFYSEDLEWESLNSYFTKISYQNLTFNGNVFAYKDLINDDDYYLSYEMSDYYKSNEIILQEVIKDIDLSTYDSNNDYIVDAIYLIYNTANNDTFKSDYHKTNIKIGDYYIKQFVTINIYDMYYDEYLDSLTLIKNTLKMLNVPEFLDNSNDGANTGIGNSCVTTNSRVDLNSFSKTLLGWSKPTVFVRGESYYSLSPFINSGELIILNASYNEKKSIYDEYFIIDYFTNDSVNRLTPLSSDAFGYAETELINGNVIYKETRGIRIYHVYSDKNKDKFINDNNSTNYSLLSLVYENDLFNSKKNIDNTILYKELDVINFSENKSNELINPFNKNFIVTIDSMNDQECLLKIKLNE